MAKNGLAGSTVGTSRSARFYQRNRAARLKKIAYDTKYHSTAKRRKYRSDLGKIPSIVGDGIDNDHVSKTKTRRRKQSANRGDKSKKIF